MNKIRITQRQRVRLAVRPGDFVVVFVNGVRLDARVCRARRGRVADMDATDSVEIVFGLQDEPSALPVVTGAPLANVYTPEADSSQNNRFGFALAWGFRHGVDAEARRLVNVRGDADRAVFDALFHRCGYTPTDEAFALYEQAFATGAAMAAHLGATHRLVDNSGDAWSAWAIN